MSVTKTFITNIYASGYNGLLLLATGYGVKTLLMATTDLVKKMEKPQERPAEDQERPAGDPVVLRE